MSDSTITLIILGVAVVVFVWDRLPVAIVALGVALTLWATRVLDLGQALAGFADPAVVFIAGLFVVSEALDSSGVTAWIGGWAMSRVGESRGRLIALTMVMAAGLTALINVNGAVAALVPVTVVMALRARRAPSELLLPLAFAAHAGSLLLLTGSPVNLIVAEYAGRDAGGAFGLFSFALVGIPLVAGTVLLVLLLAPRLLRPRRPRVALRDLSRHPELLARHYAADAEGERVTATVGIAEVMIPPRSAFIGDAAYPGMATESGRLVVAGMQRRGEQVREHMTLRQGDALLLEGSWDALEESLQNPNVLVVDDPSAVRRQAAPLGPRAYRALVVLAIMIVLLATGAVPAAVAGLLAALAMVVLRVLTVEQAYRGISWTTVILVAGMLPLSTAMVESGAAQRLADGLLVVVGGAGPYALLAGLFVLTAALGQLISNMATALIVIPVGLAAGEQMGISARPVLMAIAVFSAAAFLTPIATPANLMIKEPAGYRFGDYWKLGLPLLLLFGLVGIAVVPLIWRF